MSEQEQAAMVVETPRAHHPDCPVHYFTNHPERCRCMFMAMLDRVPRRPTAAPDQAASDGGKS